MGNVDGMPWPLFCGVYFFCFSLCCDAGFFLYLYNSFVSLFLYVLS